MDQDKLSEFVYSTTSRVILEGDLLNTVRTLLKASVPPPIPIEEDDLLVTNKKPTPKVIQYGPYSKNDLALISSKTIDTGLTLNHSIDSAAMYRVATMINLFLYDKPDFQYALDYVVKRGNWDYVPEEYRQYVPALFGAHTMEEARQRVAKMKMVFEEKNEDGTPKYDEISTLSKLLTMSKTLVAKYLDKIKKPFYVDARYEQYAGYLNSQKQTKTIRLFVVDFNDRRSEFL